VTWALVVNAMINAMIKINGQRARIGYRLPIGSMSTFTGVPQMRSTS
jgi:hypothetical protein